MLWRCWGSGNSVQFLNYCYNLDISIFASLRFVFCSFEELLFPLSYVINCMDILYYITYIVILSLCICVYTVYALVTFPPLGQNMQHLCTDVPGVPIYLLKHIRLAFYCCDQTPKRNSVKEGRFTLGGGYRGFSPLSVCSNATARG